MTGADVPRCEAEWLVKALVDVGRQLGRAELALEQARALGVDRALVVAAPDLEIEPNLGPLRWPPPTANELELKASLVKWRAGREKRERRGAIPGDRKRASQRRKP